MRRSAVRCSLVLSHDVFATKDSKRFAFFLHGIFGHKRNWRTGAQTWHQLHPDFSSVAVDLRGHGQSPIALPPPHTVFSCGKDVTALVENFGSTPSIVFAHSFGGKVALSFLQDSLRTKQQLPRDVWILDSIPFKYKRDDDRTRKSQSVFYVFEVLARMPSRFVSREWVVEELCRHELEKPIAQWLATNVTVDPSVNDKYKFQWSFSLDVIQALFEDFCELDLSSFLDEFNQQKDVKCCVHFLRAGGNPAWSPGVLEDMKMLAGGNVRLHTMPNVGHWLHTEDLHGMLSIITRESYSLRK